MATTDQNQRTTISGEIRSLHDQLASPACYGLCAVSSLVVPALT